MTDTRIAFDFSPDAFARMDRMMLRTRRTRVADLLTEALRYYEWIVDEREAGNIVGSLTHESRFIAIKE